MIEQSSSKSKSRSSSVQGHTGGANETCWEMDM